MVETFITKLNFIQDKAKIEFEKSTVIIIPVDDLKHNLFELAHFKWVSLSIPEKVVLLFRNF